MFWVSFFFILPRKGTTFYTKTQQIRRKKPSFQHFFAFLCHLNAKNAIFVGRNLQNNPKTKKGVQQ